MYCECSAGCYMRLLSEVFEKCVTMTIVDTIVNGGASECVFETSGYVEKNKFKILREIEILGRISAYLIMRIIWQWNLFNSYKQ